MSPRDARRLNVPWSTIPVAIHVSTLGAVEEPLRLVEAAMNEGHGIGMLENHVLPFEPGCHMRRERNPAIAALVTPGAVVGTDENAGASDAVIAVERRQQLAERGAIRHLAHIDAACGRKVHVPPGTRVDFENLRDSGTLVALQLHAEDPAQARCLDEPIDSCDDVWHIRLRDTAKISAVSEMGRIHPQSLPRETRVDPAALSSEAVHEVVIGGRAGDVLLQHDAESRGR